MVMLCLLPRAIFADSMANHSKNHRPYQIVRDHMDDNRAKRLTIFLASFASLIKNLFTRKSLTRIARENRCRSFYPMSTFLTFCMKEHQIVTS